MDLIYTDPNKEDIGVLFGYEFDLAFGADENNFECKIQADAHCMKAGCFLYIEGTEYGGIVDGIKVDTGNGTVVYKGRTWHGILAGHVILPPESSEITQSGSNCYMTLVNSHLSVSGDGNAVLAGLIQYLGLTSLFAADTAESDIVITNYLFDRYTDAYTGIRKMLAEFNGKLKMAYKNGKVILSAVYLTDYSQDEEWDASQIDFSVEKNFRPINHLVCLGSGNLSERHVIHLFTDENGGVQPYKTVDNPLSDADYILDKSKQILFGYDESADVYDYSSAQVRENYVKLTEQPEDWATNFAQYFTLDDTESFIAVEGVPEQQATAITSKPSNWDTHFGNYYVQKSDEYVPVEADTANKYVRMYSKPDDWETNYASYYTYFTDGVTETWSAVQGVQKTRYNPQTMKPSDWKTNYAAYFQRKRDGGFEAVKPKCYVQFGVSFEEAPEWEAKRYYTAENYYVAPEFFGGVVLVNYYRLSPTTTAPTWESGKYFSIETVYVKPPFAKNKYFAKKLDHYAEMVAGGIEKLKESYNCDSISIDLDLSGEYDIGDIVGATERTTGVAVWQPITKKIVSIVNNKESVNYEIGVK